MQNDFSENIKKKLPIFLKGTIIGVAITLISMVVFAAIMLIFDLDRSLSVPFSTVSLAIGCFVAAMYTSKSIGPCPLPRVFFISSRFPEGQNLHRKLQVSLGSM